jgi:hypothetical protein
MARAENRRVQGENFINPAFTIIPNFVRCEVNQDHEPGSYTA